MSRLESLFDAVIALALTLIVVSVEVPSSFDELLNSFKKLPAFAFSFAVMVMCWYYHYLFHRRYGLEDFPLVILNTILMFLIVFYVYPLKFLSALMFDRNSIQVRDEQLPYLMLMYSGGFVAIFTLLLFMYVYAYWKRDGLELNGSEQLQTRGKFIELSIYIVLGLLSTAIVFSPIPLQWAGMVYFLIGPMQGLNGYLWGRQLDKYISEEDCA